MKLTKRKPRDSITKRAEALGFLLDIQRAKNRPVFESEIAYAARRFQCNYERLKPHAYFINRNFIGR